MSNFYCWLLLLLLIYLLIVVSPAIISAAVTLPSDVAALSVFRSAITPSSINPWSCLASWNFTSDPCRPLVPSHFTCGITCSPTDDKAPSTFFRISAITLDPAGYSGNLSPSLANLTSLSHLDLFDNSFHGPIPLSLFSQLPSLRTLVLARNSFSGPIPLSLSKLSSIETIDLSYNSLTGTIPTFTPNSLSTLASLDVSFNRLSGPLPSSLPPNLVQLALRGNSIDGALKRSTFESLKYLEVAELAANRLGGKLEGWFFQLPSLQQVDLANNSITSVQVWQPSSKGAQPLVAIDLSFNRIEGELPAALAGFSSLTAVSARHNRLRGQIPWQYGKFRRLFLDGNFLNGEVPSAVLMNRDLAGSLGDNCLEKCPRSMSVCSPSQKPDWVCKEVYAAGGRGRPRRPSP